jgi:flagellar protein FlbD
MIRLTRLNNQSFIVNSDLIKFVEQSPDTLITLTSGEKIVVKENAEQVLQRVISFRRSVLEAVSSAGGNSSVAHNLSALHPESGKGEPQK